MARAVEGSGGRDGRIAGCCGEASLHINLASLESSIKPHFGNPKELAVLSTTVKDDQKLREDCEKAENISEELKKSTVTSTCRRTLHEDSTAHRMDFSVPKNLEFNLYSGYGDQIQYDDTNEHMNILLECLMKESLVGRSDFVCSRRALIGLGTAPYAASGGLKFDQGLKIAIQKFGGVYYMYEFPTTKLKLRRSTLNDDGKLKEYGGMKFESYVTAKPDQLPDIESPLNYNDEFHSVVRSEIGPHSLIYRCEVDCCFHENRKQYIELKTRREFDCDSQQKSFHQWSLVAWWLQAILGGINWIFCGFRNDSGVVKRCEWFKVSKIPEMFELYGRKPSLCLASIESFLTFVNTTCNVAKDLDVYVFTREAGKTVFTVELDESREHKFLPYWFVDQNA